MSEPAWVALGTAELEVDAVEHDEVTVAGVRLLSTKLVAGDAEPAFRIMGDGKLEWGGGGGTPPDTVLQRESAKLLRLLDTGLVSRRTNATDPLVYGAVISESSARLAIYADGKMEWGDGAAARDTILKRGGAGILQTDGNFFSTGQLRAAAAQSGQVAVGNLPSGNPSIAFGTAADTTLYRSAASTLKTESALNVNGLLYAGYNGSLYMLQVGTGGVGFNGTGAVVKQAVSGSRAGNVALTNLLTALAACGLITNSTSA